MTTSVTCRGLKLALAAGLTITGAAQAQTQVYKCTDAQGRVEFTDSNKKGCKVLDLPGYIPAPPARAVAPAPAPAARTNSPAGSAAAAAPSPSDFPRVDTSQQRARDNDRREILNEELRAEEQKLAEQRREFNNGEPPRNGNERNYAKYQERVAQMREDIGRTERNIEALRREIGNIR
ncbi:DUF4124 domain-containing protein [Massilia sp. YIM B02769]|uniref:DUF4124 domain-containing protein n=1 Tax=unclassified Massilia TaxID=2609279 RepID=UPI0025B6EC09|nr:MULTISPECIES: DUF4124 domain-containing protein [unclassified Massilia]MDN4061407.1 DUF4124 domain-containing protein [Massilia sp. YIM B02769]